MKLIMKNENKIKNIAEFLKDKRREKNLSLEKLSDLSKIQVYHLEALEAGQFEKLPPSIYRAGIFKRIAKFLDISDEEIVKLYKNENHLIVEPSYANEAISPKENHYFILTPKKLTVFVGGLLLILFSAYLWYQLNFLIGPPNLVVNPKEDFITKEEFIAIKGQTDNGIDLTINGENVYVSSDGNFSKDIQLAAGLNIIEVKAANNFGKITKIVRQILREY
ncbi:MAG: hypothetical protein UV48_C0019G0012 [Candidatus Azambacteria bacterium GW2011_GWA2_42_9]|uniref:HTH cro/C1-type domain-containing protein n=4 Tax=Candidatus Azamiibacteriota TaxID=1752741 RepID=A0A0G1C7Y0_9BACT|nr:MAG: hypothetical protein UV07_C0007G0012 [Candidatus Azambacteria bacterium GW2011_GWB1_42_17]KKS45738.1 MAG: hypothetical protein UV10_C0015G0011 [Candidatus Azambacteria bacterium GW2011_GWA1_42_19]KKS75087.1 MAG: hypothetical protein UV48_C0019G0012 [Candidatus Azambacteria bacterium GW2011_GWA2_42_9]KKS88633.1 MAG: XRE family transcriptional regulator [Parcubacteria group bacterium GW2011_GWC1_43_11]